MGRGLGIVPLAFDPSQAVWQGDVVAIKINGLHLTIKAKQSVAPYRHRAANEMGEGETPRQLTEKGLKLSSGRGLSAIFTRHMFKAYTKNGIFFILSYLRQCFFEFEKKSGYSNVIF